MDHSINLWNFKPRSVVTALLGHSDTDYRHQGKQTDIEDMSSTLLGVICRLRLSP